MPQEHNRGWEELKEEWIKELFDSGWALQSAHEAVAFTITKLEEKLEEIEREFRKKQELGVLLLHEDALSIIKSHKTK